MKSLQKYGSYVLELIPAVLIIGGVLWMASDINGLAQTVHDNKHERNQLLTEVNDRIQALELRVVELEKKLEIEIEKDIGTGL